MDERKIEKIIFFFRKMDADTDAIYERKLKIFIFNLLNDIVTDNTLLPQYVTPENLKIWNTAFIHESIDKQINYEDLEILGDRGLEFFFSYYMLQKFPQLNRSNLTTLKSTFMSKIEQAEYSRKLKLDTMIRTRNVTINDAILEDVFEAFMGALIRVSDGIENGLGYKNGMMMMKFLFEDAKIDVTAEYATYKSQVIQHYLEPAGWLKPDDTDVIPDQNGYKRTIRLTSEGLRRARADGFNLPAILGVGYGRTQTSSIESAYLNALNTLKAYGVTREWAEKKQKQREFGKFKALMPAVYARMRKEGYVDLEFSSPKAMNQYGEYTTQLVGIDKNGVKKILGTVTSPSNDRDASREKLLRDYGSK